ncbi:MAG: stage III sporulation protein AB [Clostridia bacterium]|nr:stage III sporulation protein AB [Clostridia bacterium]
MTLIFKAAGLGILFICCSAAGFLKSSALKKRADKLSCFIKNLQELSERIRSGEGEIKQLCSICFEKNLGEFENGRFSFSKDFLTKEDISLLSEFFENLGMRDSLREYERCMLYKKLIENKQSDAEGDFRSLSGLYNTLGVLCGVFLIIILL